MSEDEIREVQRIVKHAPVADHVMKYALRLVRATRVREEADPAAPRPKLIDDYVAWGAGPRASEYLILAAKAKAVLDGASHVTPDHVRAVAHPVLRHRILTNFNAEADQITTDAIIDGLLESIPLESSPDEERRQMDRVLKS